MPKWSVLVLSVLLGGLAAGCDASLTCSTSLCQDAQTQLYCDGTALHRAVCRGPDGCQARVQTDGSQNVTCDFRGAQAGDECDVGGAQFGFCVDANTAAMFCDGKTFHRQACANGCSTTTDATGFRCQ
jgi:hypothetical protein